MKPDLTLALAAIRAADQLDAERDDVLVRADDAHRRAAVRSTIDGVRDAIEDDDGITEEILHAVGVSTSSARERAIRTRLDEAANKLDGSTR
jgi:hypothetical protein